MFRFRLVVLLAICFVDSFLSAAAKPQPLRPDSIVLTIELSPDEPLLQVTLYQLMAIFKEPGLSIAVIDHNRIAWAKGFGVTSASGQTLVTPQTLFQAASISKPITAAGALWLVQQGRLSLDEDVNDKLKHWHVPDNEFTYSEKVTLRRILSHNAGLNVHGFNGYEKGQPLPTTEQTLDGLPPANNPAVRVTATPGKECNYSGGGYTIAGLLVKDVSGQSFEDFMLQHVLRPSGMTRSTFAQNLPPAVALQSATGTDQNGEPLPGQWRIYPELAPDGLWTTPTDLAKFAIEIARSKRGKANHILSASTVQQMLTVQCHDDPGQPDGTGLGFALGYQHHLDIFFHNGSNAGFQSLLMMDPDAGWGYAAMGNSDNFQPVNRTIFSTLSNWYGWGVASDSRDLGQNLVIIRTLKDTRTALDYYRRMKSNRFKNLRHDVNTLNNFGYRVLGEKKFAEAILIFQLNVAEYPQDANVYDSLGEAFMDAGERDSAIKNYEKSLELNPKNDNASQRLKALRNQ